MVHLEDNLDPERGTLLDRERLVLETLESAGGGEVNKDVVAAFDFESERLDNAFAGVVGVADGVAGVQTQRGFPAIEGFVVLVCMSGRLVTCSEKMCLRECGWDCMSTGVTECIR